MSRKLVHVHFPSSPPLYPSYKLASRLQELLRRHHLDLKDKISGQQLPTTAPLPPTLISFTPPPTYTLGRRQTEPLSEAEDRRLRAPLHIYRRSRYSNDNNSDDQPPPQPAVMKPTVCTSPRGGLTTYHGPGQIVLWPVIDLRSAHHKQFTVRCYSRLLEDTTAATLNAVGRRTVGRGLEAFTTDDPGVWVNSHYHRSGAGAGGDDDEVVVVPAKIAALGVHLRRHVSGLGTAINVDMPGLPPPLLLPASSGGRKREEGDDENEKVNPWARIVPCGLEGKPVTSLVEQLEMMRRRMGTTSNTTTRGPTTTATITTTAGGGSSGIEETGEAQISVSEKEVAEVWAEEFARRIGCVDGIETIKLDEPVLRLVLRAIQESY